MNNFSRNITILPKTLCLGRIKKIINFIQQNCKTKIFLKTYKTYNSKIYKFLTTKIMTLLP